MLEYQVVSDVCLIGTTKLKDPGTCTGGDNDLTATEKPASCEQSDRVLGRNGVYTTIRDGHHSFGPRYPLIVLEDDALRGDAYERLRGAYDFFKYATRRGAKSARRVSRRLLALLALPHIRTLSEPQTNAVGELLCGELIADSFRIHRRLLTKGANGPNCQCYDGLCEGEHMDGNREQTFEGFAYDMIRPELPTWSLLGKYGGRVATQTFRLQKGGENSPRHVTSKEVEMRGRRIRGRIFRRDEDEARGLVDENGIARASYVRDK
jgi:hypothetical protein